MTMPIQFDTAQYIKRLIEAGIPQQHAEALADGLQFALSQPVANDADLLIWRAEVEAMFTRHEIKMKEWVRAQLRPLYWLHGVNIIMSTIILAKLFL
ncbi:hypothetical protein [Pseudoduganella sp.]|uniref:hypothetical protein n=1 Tax=Pseudoduganella sp. TaxID=1880898 RepID=UPI0035B0F321